MNYINIFIAEIVISFPPFKIDAEEKVEAPAVDGKYCF